MMMLCANRASIAIDFTYFLCRIAFLMLIAIYTARGNDTAQVPRHTRSGIHHISSHCGLELGQHCFEP